MKLFNPADGLSADWGNAIVHNDGCPCGDCAAYDSGKRQTGDTRDTVSGPGVPTVAPAVVDVSPSPLGPQIGISTPVLASLDGLDFAPPANVSDADTVPGDAGTTATITPGTSVDVTIETLGDHDWYAVTLTAGTTYTIQTNIIAGSNPDTFLTLRNSAGTSLASDDDGGDSTFSVLNFTATTTGTYYIDASTFDDESTGSYHLSITALPPAGADFVVATTATAATLAVGGSTAGRIDASGDHDWYAITLTAGQTYLLSTGGTVPAGTVDTTLTVRDSAGTQLVTNDDAGEFAYSAIRFTATATGTYYLDVGGFGSGTGDFTLTAFTTPPLAAFTNDQIADQLLNGYWGGAANARHFNVAPGGTITFNVTALTAAGQTLARAAFELWSDATGINFSEIVGTANITLDDNQTGAFASSVRSGNIITSSTVNVGTAWLTTYGTGLNTYSFQTYIHEIGHAIGLGHAGNYNGSASYATDALYLNDAWATTVMSYFSQDENSFFAGQGFTRQFVVSPIVADVLALSIAYGTPTTTRTGDTVYGFNNTSGRSIYDATQFPSVTYTIVDHGGTDTLDYSGFTQNQRIDLNAEAFSNIGARIGNVTIARGAVIENAIGGSGNDVLIGNAANNVLRGNGGTNTLEGNDGNDTLEVIAAGQASSVDGGSGTDTLSVVGAVVLGGTLVSIEAVALTPGAALTLTSAQLSGLALDAQFSGTGTVTINLQTVVELGVGQFAGSAFGFAGGSSVQFVVNGTADTDVFKGANTASTINGGDGGDQIRGSSAVDTIFGGDGNDKISGVLGADIITGGAGADRFRYGSMADSGTGAGADRIMDFVSGTDFIVLNAIDADPVAPGQQHLSYIGTAALANTGSGQLRWSTSGGDILVEADFNGDGIADMHIVLVGLGGGTLTAADFLL